MATAACCPTDKTVAAVSGVYASMGRMEKVNSMDCYVVGSGPHAVVMVYDIFGFHNNNFELADSISQNKGWTVLIPDLFRGSPWPAVNFPPRGQDQAAMLSRFLTTQADASQRSLDIISVIDHFKTKGRMQFSVLGFCWGGKAASLVNDYPGVRSIAGAHPSFLSGSDGVNVNIPCLWLPTGDDDISEYIEGFTAGKRARLITVSGEFSDMFHGFMASRGDWSNERVRDRVSQATRLLVSFFESHLT